MADEFGEVWAPIALFVFKRPEHTRLTIQSLQRCIGFDQSPVYVFADGARNEREGDAVQATRAVARALLGERATYVERASNLGVLRSIVSGVTDLCERHGRVIVVEDDLSLAPQFLQFVNEGLRRYEAEPRVMHVAGYIFESPEVPPDEALFLPMINSWGWATWKRAWDLYDPEVRGWQNLLADRTERRRFDLDGHMPGGKMLKIEMTSGLQAWDVRWYYSVFKNNGLVLYPPRTLVVNTGLDGTGTHHRLGRRMRQAPLAGSGAIRFPTTVAESDKKEHVFDAIQAFMSHTARQTLAALPRAVWRRVSTGWSR